MPNGPSLRKQSIYLFAGKLSSFSFRFIAPIILVRILSQGEYGIYQQFNLIALTFIPILSLGLGSSLYYFYPIAKGKDKSVYMGQTFMVLSFVGAIFFIFYMLFGLKINSFIGVDLLNNYRFIIPIYILFMIVSNLSNFIFTVEKRIKHNLIFFPADVFVKTALLITFALFYKISSGCIYALLFYSLLRSGFVTKYLYNHLKIAFTSLKTSLLINQLKYSLPFAGAIIVNTLSMRMDKLIVNKFITVEEFAVYSVAFFTLPLVSDTVDTIQSVLVPKLSKHFQEGQIDKASELWKKSVTVIASINIPLIIFFLGNCR